MNIYKISTIILIVLLIGSGYYIYSKSSGIPGKSFVDNAQTTKVGNDDILISSKFASTESANFRAYAMLKFKEVLEVITLKEDLKQDSDPAWFGGCNGSWLRPICEISIANITSDSDDSVKGVLSDCMVKPSISFNFLIYKKCDIKGHSGPSFYYSENTTILGKSPWGGWMNEVRNCFI